MMGAAQRSSSPLPTCRVSVPPRVARPRVVRSEANIGVVFKALGHHGESPELHKTLVVAAGDLAFRFPNVLEPYTDYIYMPLK